MDTLAKQKQLQEIIKEMHKELINTTLSNTNSFNSLVNTANKRNTLLNKLEAAKRLLQHYNDLIEVGL